MDVKDVNVVSLQGGNSPEKVPLNEPPNTTKDTAVVPVHDESAVSIDLHSQSNVSTDVITSLNDVISAANVASKSTDEISRYMRSIDGIVEQAYQGKVPTDKLGILEKEANGLVDAIKTTAKGETPTGLKPLAGDPLIAMIDEKIGEALDVILPDTATKAFSVGVVRLSNKDFIVQTRAAVAEALSQMEDLKKALDKAISQIQEAANTVDVAMQNKKASTASLRDVDEALRFVGQTKVNISAHPQTALESFGKLGNRALQLLSLD